jgi:hypothetical protein
VWVCTAGGLVRRLASERAGYENAAAGKVQGRRSASLSPAVLLDTGLKVNALLLTSGFDR